MLAAKGRVRLSDSPGEFRRLLLTRGVREVVLDGAIAIEAAQLHELPGDPADRIIAASTRLLEAQLLTADRKLLRSRLVKTRDARK